MLYFGKHFDKDKQSSFYQSISSLDIPNTKTVYEKGFWGFNLPPKYFIVNKLSLYKLFNCNNLHNNENIS